MKTRVCTANIPTRGRVRLLCLVVSVLLGTLPTVAHAATLPGGWLPYSQPTWASYLPGLGGSGATQPTSAPAPASPGKLTTATYAGGGGAGSIVVARTVCSQPNSPDATAARAAV